MKAKAIILTYILAIGALMIILISSRNIKHEAMYASENLLETIIKKSTDKTSTNFGARAAFRYNEGKTNANPFGVVNKNFVGSDTPHYLGGEGTWNAKIKNADKTNKRIATFGDTKSKKIILLLGDSHANRYKYAFDIIGKQLSYKIVFCETSEIGTVNELSSDFGEFFKSYNDKMGKIKGQSSVSLTNERFYFVKDELIPKATFVVVSLRNYKYIKNHPYRNKTATYDDKNITSIKETFLYIKNKTGHYPILIQDNPQFDFKDGDLTSTKDITNATGKYKDVLKDRLNEIYSKKLFNYLITDPLFYDKKGVSHSYIGGLSLMEDYNHASSTYLCSATEYLMRELRKFGVN